MSNKDNDLKALLDLPIGSPDLLPLFPNPYITKDYVVRMLYEPPKLAVRLDLRLVPDRTLIDDDIFQNIAQQIYTRTNPQKGDLPSILNWGGALMNLINNELVPRYIQLLVVRLHDGNSENPVPPHIAAIFEDRIPGYHNRDLIQSATRISPL